MRVLRRHRLVKFDLQAAFDWYEDQQAGLGGEFLDEFRRFHDRLSTEAMQHAFRFGKVRRLNLKRFPYGIFYTANE